ncbi:MAG TPA: multifunctional oxoglutarate decarboxylase/oxoglutarate dehydrogenase thiamine pyrophosphate-binding subunit/dihydrolipoyllysine-residue succinyltransferase subunit, partial [Microbacteriaceae bacterium]|nr:multifunctional oxoglutarate decarboxylase/oxoglutarate dehydrogenase thiamine pyrophosphate-binding subunit/dihydrolipoyllysine-residue succinyltransferase subunit [Microbacteriaceae bacterium]
DFANGAQTVIDEFVTSAEQKWGQRSSLVLLLPHGYEGQGPDHSSARIERYLQMCAEDNLTVAQPSTPASYFHLLRRQAYSHPRKPLVVFTPKSMLRLRGATSEVADFTSGRFEPIIDDHGVANKAGVRRVLLTSGKLYYDLASHLEKNPDDRIAVVRVEQYYPLPAARLTEVLAGYPNAELFWVQEEPENQGAWPYMIVETSKLGPRPLGVISRAASASPATGSAKRHAAEQNELVTRALAF